MEFDSYSTRPLRRGHAAFEHSVESSTSCRPATSRISSGCASAGSLLAGGPYRDQEDETFRGMCALPHGLEETRQLVALDPSMQAGRLRAEVMTWLTARGELASRGSNDQDEERRMSEQAEATAPATTPFA